MAQSFDQNPGLGPRFKWRPGEAWRQLRLFVQLSYFSQSTRAAGGTWQKCWKVQQPTNWLFQILQTPWVFMSQSSACRSLGISASILPLWLWGSSANPLDLLSRTFQNHRKSSLEMVQVKRPFFEQEEVTLRVAIDPARKMRVDVLRPLVHEGVISVDDGRTLKTYYPDQNRTVSQSSPLLRKPDNAGRLKLIESNYTLTADPGPRVAGRPTFQILLRPKNQSLPGQAIFVDEEKFLPLRIQADTARQERVTILDTVFVRYGRPARSIRFSVPEGKDVDLVKAWGPVYVNDLNKEASGLGFIPQIPKRLPYGFTVQSMALQGSKAKPVLAVTLTDGLLSTNIFLWSKVVHGRTNPISRDPLFERDGVFFAVYGDSPPQLARTLLSVFVIEKRATALLPDGTGNTPHLLVR